MDQIVNAAPMEIQLGTQDLSTRQLPKEPEAIPQHLPKFYLFTEKGPLTPQLTDSESRLRIFGDKTFDVRSAYGNHATVFANLANANANSCMIQRVVPDDACPEAVITLWLDVLPVDVDLYCRAADNSIIYDAQTGDPTLCGGVTPGFKVKWVTSVGQGDCGTVLVGQDNVFGALVSKPGDQVDGAVTSTRYPIMQFKVSSIGDHGNNVGIRLWGMTTANSPVLPTTMMDTDKAFPYYISVIRRKDANSTPKIVETLFGEQKMLVTLKKDVINPLTDQSLYIGDNFINAYQNLTDLRYSKVFGEFGAMHIYESYIETLLTQFHAAETDFIGASSDFTIAATDKHLFNFLTGVNSDNTPYNSYVFDDASIRLSDITNVYAGGGSDGTMTDAAFDTLVADEALRYLDVNDEVQDSVINVESVVYDSGFALTTKYALMAVMAVRKDTFAIIATHEVNGATLTPSEEYSKAIALRTRMQMYPESNYFGTPVMRGLIQGNSGLLRGSAYKKRLPLTAERLIKACKYMGAGNGRWKAEYNFDSAPGNVIESMYDISNTWVPTDVRNRYWDAGLNWVQSYDRRSFFFPSHKTVYDDDTSVLNSFFTAMAICYLNKVNSAAWREFTGNSKLSAGQLTDAVNNFINRRVANKFDDRFVIVPNANFTDMDVLRGYSWTTPVKIYAANMKTVMTSYVQAYRIEDLQN